MELIIVLVIIASVIFSLVGAARKKAAETQKKIRPQYETDNSGRQSPNGTASCSAYEPVFEGQSAEEASVPPEPTVASITESVRTFDETVPAGNNPLGLFQDTDECVKAVIYSEILRKKFK